MEPLSGKRPAERHFAGATPPKRPSSTPHLWLLVKGAQAAIKVAVAELEDVAELLELVRNKVAPRLEMVPLDALQLFRSEASQQQGEAALESHTAVDTLKDGTVGTSTEPLYVHFASPEGKAELALEPEEAPAARGEHVDMRAERGEVLVQFVPNEAFLEVLSGKVGKLLENCCFGMPESRAFVFTGMSGTGKTRTLLELPAEFRRRLASRTAAADGVYVGFNKSQPCSSQALGFPQASLDNPDFNVGKLQVWLARRIVLLLRARKGRTGALKGGAEDLPQVYFAPAAMEELVEQTAGSSAMREVDKNPGMALARLLAQLRPAVPADAESKPFLFLVLIDEIQLLRRKGLHRALLRAARTLQVQVHTHTAGQVLLVAVGTGTFAGDFREPSMGVAGVTEHLDVPLYLSKESRLNIWLSREGSGEDADFLLRMTEPSVRLLVQRKVDHEQLLHSKKGFELPVDWKKQDFMCEILWSVLRGSSMQAVEEDLAGLCWEDAANGKVRFKFVLAQRKDLLSYLKLHGLANQLEDYISLESAWLRPHMQFQDWETATWALLAMRLAAEGILQRSFHFCFVSLLTQVFGTSTQSLSSTRLAESRCILKEVQAIGSLRKKVPAHVSQDPTPQLSEFLVRKVSCMTDGDALVLNANATSRCQHEPFDILVCIRMADMDFLMFLVDCHSVQSDEARAAGKSASTMDQKAKVVCNAFTDAGLGKVTACTVLVSNFLATEPEVVEQQSGRFHIVMGRKELEHLMPPWSTDFRA